jgi:hypothetical protein
MSYPARGPSRRAGIDGKANASGGRQLDARVIAIRVEAEA